MHQIQRVFLFEPCFGKMTGHWESNTRRFSTEFKKNGASFTVFCQRDPQEAIIAGLDVIPTFTANTFADLSTETAFDQEVDNFRKDYATIDPSQFRKGDLLLFTTVMPQSHKATMEWLSPIIRPDGPQAAFIFMIGAGDFQDNFMDKKLLLSLMSIPFLRRFAMKQLYTWKESLYKKCYRTYIQNYAHQQETKGYYYFGGCEEYSMNFSSIFHVPVRTLPFPTVPLTPRPDHTHDKKNKHTIKIGYFGHASLEKGAQFLETIVKKITTRFPQVEFHLHINPNIHTEAILSVFQKPMTNVVCYHGHRTQEELTSLIQQVDINLLPYAPVKYAGLPSMVFTEAMSAANIVVVPEYTWLSRKAREVNAGYTAFKKYNQDSIYHALVKAINRFSELKKKTNTAKETFMKTNNVTTYVNQILDAINT